MPDINPRWDFNFGGVTLLGTKPRVPVVPVPCLTLDRLNTPRVDFVKIDVEGMEAEVLRGGEQMLKKFKPVLYLENDRLENSEALIQLIAGFGYRMFWHLPPLFNPDNYFANAEDCYPGILSFNMLCIHRDSNVRFDGLEEVTDFSFHPIREASAARSSRQAKSPMNTPIAPRRPSWITAIAGLRRWRK